MQEVMLAGLGDDLRCRLSKVVDSPDPKTFPHLVNLQLTNRSQDT